MSWTYLCECGHSLAMHAAAAPAAAPKRCQAEGCSCKRYQDSGRQEAEEAPA